MQTIDQRIEFERRRRGLTLVELLVAMGVVAILAGLVIVAARGVQNEAQTAKTRSTISKIQEVIGSRWSEYLTQQIPMELPPLAYQKALDGTRVMSSREIARARLLALRDLQRMELPDRYLDLFNPPITIKMSSSMGMALTSVERTSVSQALVARFSMPLSNGNARVANTVDNAELLYEIVVGTVLDGSSAIELFKPSEIGDIDGDELNEFIDAWGRPIQFIRWPAGYAANFGPMTDLDPFVLEQLRRVDPTVVDANVRGMDPLDVNMSDWGFDLVGATPDDRPWRRERGLFPLIYSAGPDGVSGYRELLAPAALRTDPTNTYSAVSWPYSGGPPIPGAYAPYSYVDPYHPRNGVVTDLVGSVTDAVAVQDNLTNYDPTGASL